MKNEGKNNSTESPNKDKDKKDTKDKTNDQGKKNATETANSTSTQVVYSAAVFVIPVITATWSKKPTFLLN